MKTLLRGVMIVAAIAVAFWAWKRLPGVRTKVETAVEEYGGWTPEAREADPVGFIEYAQERLASDLENFEDGIESLEEVRAKSEERLRENRELAAAAESLAGSFREAYRWAETDGYPVQVSGQEYDREQLLDQVRLLLAQLESYQSIVVDYEGVLVAVKERHADLSVRVPNTRAMLETLEAKKELALLREQTAATDKLLVELDEVLGRNRETLEALDTPVRTVEELIDDSTQGGIVTTTAGPDPLLVLEAGDG